MFFLMAALSQAQSISPASATLKPSQTQQFAVPNAIRTAYSWSIYPSTGTISASGLYTAPATITAPTTVTVYAEYVTAPSRPYLSATVTLMPQVSISISPTWISMTNGQSAVFTGTVTGATDTAVTWAGPTVGSVNSGGVYTVPLSITTPQTITLTVYSQLDPTKSATATIAITPTIAVSLNPTSTSLTSGQSTSLNATVTGTTNPAVTWTLSPQVGTISNGVYTAPSPITSAQSVTVTATSQVATGATASVNLSLVPAVSIAVTPTSKTLTSGQSATFTASVSGSSNTGVTWSVTPAVGTVASGVYTAPALVTTAQSVTVKATSAADSTKSASATVSLTPSVSISMTPSSASLTGGKSSTFTATVKGSSNTSVNWSMSPSVGTLAAGVYTAPSIIASAQTVTVTAASAADPTKNVSAKVSLVPVAVTVSPSTASLTGGQSSTLTASVTGSSNTGVSWSISPSVGTVVGGVYTAPAVIAAAQTITVKATSTADATKSASAAITLTPVGITVSPTAATLSQGQSTTLTAKVSGSSNLGVNWSISPAVGSIISGVYTAPASIASAQTVTVTATSAANPAKTASAAISLTPPAPAVSISVTPTSASLTGGQGAVFAATVTGSSNLAVNWTLSPQLGTLTNGVYTAPALILLQQTVTVAAVSAADPTKIAAASITLIPSVSVSVAPTTASLSPSQSQQFSASLSGTTNPNVTWSMSPSVGSLGNGLYQAPATINSQQTVTVTATSLADPTKTGSATITLVPTVGIALTPSSTSLTGGQSTQFNVSIGGVPSTAVTWALAPSVGTITNGVYTAPVTVTALQTIVLTVASIANPTQTATANITLTASTGSGTSVSPSIASLSPSGTQQFTASGLGTNPVWTLSPATGTITTAGLYAAPSSVTTQTTVTVTATSATDSTKAASASVTLNPAASQTAPPTTITLPVEVMGANGTTATVSFNIPAGTNLSGLNLWMQIHGLRTETQASVQLNSGGWQPIAQGPVTLLGQASAFGGIGGGFHTIQMTMPATSITTGTNTLAFKFNATDGRVSGFRVLAFNIQDSNGNSLLPSSTFVQDDPSTWQPPLSDQSDITEGQALWRTASLVVPSTSGGATAIKAHCMDCHSEDGRDLKYFNYSNYSIHSRAVFHGLTAQQGDQIASYIRSLNLPNPGRPWNPPYQPGPGLDSQPVSNWAAGAGLSAVLDTDADMEPFLVPGGSTSAWAATSYLNQRELPITLQLPDWNSWLPTIHPMDAFGSAFTGSTCNSDYALVRSELQPNSTSAYKYGLQYLDEWGVACSGYFLPPIDGTNNWTPTLASSVYAAAVWQMVKLWEINQEFGLEGMNQVAFGSKANVRGWYTTQAFNTSPNLLHIPVGPGIGNGTSAAWTYIGYTWYHIQLIFNDGQGQLTNRPIDYGYAASSVRNLSLSCGDAPLAMLDFVWLIKALQENTLNGGGPDPTGGAYGFTPTEGSPLDLVDSGFDTDWSATSPSTRAQLTEDFVKAWFAQISSYSVSQYYTGKDGNGRPWASATENVSQDNYLTEFGGQVWYMLPRLRYVGVDASLTYQISAWAATLWPKTNWAAVNSATCTSLGTCTSDVP
jgi:hypothetical protein